MRFLQRRLVWGGFHEVAILLGMMAAVAFADDQHDVWRAEAAAIYLHLVGSMNQLGNLLRCQLVGIDAELESVDRQIEFGMILLCEGVLHLADGSSRHQLMVSHPCCARRCRWK